ncbi:hypothetical protein EYF80_007429 [Liparis tanakae]|uniref:Uncharacterized protein n=1 Tax=Liparis tanakae TaxID=230148 RepID=A0A4Z2IXV0_9TELE|nr:hypothetical protein EYF80_007429 [Liparis tanakae]
MKDRGVLAGTREGEGDCETEMERLGVEKERGPVKVNMPGDWTAGKPGEKAGCCPAGQMAGSSRGLETRTGANPPAKPVTAAADRSSVGGGFTTTVISPMVEKR